MEPSAKKREIVPEQTPSPIKPIDDSQSQNAQVPVVVYAIMNKKSKFMVPSRANYFGGFAVERVMIDSGCSSHLLPIIIGDNQATTSKEAFDVLLHLFPLKDYRWSLERSTGVGSRFLKLVVQRKDGNRVRVTLMDGIGRAMLNCLYFYLCYDDLRYVCEHNLIKHVSTAERTAIDEFKPTEITRARRTHALLGQDVLRECATLQVSKSLVAITLATFEDDRSNVLTALDSCSAAYPELPQELAYEECDELDASLMTEVDDIESD